MKVDCSSGSANPGDFVRVAKRASLFHAHREYRLSFRQVAGRVFPIVGWNVTALAWILVRRGEVLSVEPELLVVVRRCRARKRNVIRYGLI